MSPSYTDIEAMEARAEAEETVKQITDFLESKDRTISALEQKLQTAEKAREHQHMLKDQVEEDLQRMEDENAMLRKEFWSALATWRHMVNCGVSFEGEYGDEWIRLAKISRHQNLHTSGSSEKSSGKVGGAAGPAGEVEHSVSNGEVAGSTPAPRTQCPDCEMHSDCCGQSCGKHGQASQDSRRSSLEPVAAGGEEKAEPSGLAVASKSEASSPSSAEPPQTDYHDIAVAEAAKDRKRGMPNCEFGIQTYSQEDYDRGVEIGFTRGFKAGAAYVTRPELSLKEEVKLIERTCKYDAYSAVWMWVRGGTKDFRPDHGSAAWYAAQKMEGHRVWLAEQPLRYAYVRGLVPNEGYYDREKADSTSPKELKNG